MFAFTLTQFCARPTSDHSGPELRVEKTAPNRSWSHVKSDGFLICSQACVWGQVYWQGHNVQTAHTSPAPDPSAEKMPCVQTTTDMQGGILSCVMPGTSPNYLFCTGLFQEELRKCVLWTVCLWDWEQTFLDSLLLMLRSLCGCVWKHDMSSTW